jgi:hypothetical protein
MRNIDDYWVCLYIEGETRDFEKALTFVPIWYAVYTPPKGQKENTSVRRLRPTMPGRIGARADRLEPCHDTRVVLVVHLLAPPGKRLRSVLREAGAGEAGSACGEADSAWRERRAARGGRDFRAAYCRAICCFSSVRSTKKSGGGSIRGAGLARFSVPVGVSGVLSITPVYLPCNFAARRSNV